MMANAPGDYTITGTITDSSGLSTPFTAKATIAASPPVIVSASVTPQSAPAGTTRTLTIVATDPQGGAITYNPVAAGITFTPTTTPGVFTFVL